VKGHLRTLYRKFGIEDLPHNQKRARLVELVVEGGYLGPGVGDATPSREAAGVEPAASAAAEQVGRRRRLWPIAATGVAVIVAAIAALGLSGAFSRGTPATTGAAAYRTAVRGYCRLALAGEEKNPGPSTRQRAGSYLEVIETMRGRLESLPPPAGVDRALERFRSGLTHAANFTSVVAQNPPPPGTRAEADVVAELTFAAGQVQAGALGYDLGASCLAIGDLVTRSARNAAHAP
jgi:hypothetical protein